MRLDAQQSLICTSRGPAFAFFEIEPPRQTSDNNRGLQQHRVSRPSLPRCSALSTTIRRPRRRQSSSTPTPLVSWREDGSQRHSPTLMRTVDDGEARERQRTMDVDSAMQVCAPCNSCASPYKSSYILHIARAARWLSQCASVTSTRQRFDHGWAAVFFPQYLTRILNLRYEVMENPISRRRIHCRGANGVCCTRWPRPRY